MNHLINFLKAALVLFVLPLALLGRAVSKYNLILLTFLRRLLDERGESE